jgi:hypothetical protein
MFGTRDSWWYRAVGMQEIAIFLSQLLETRFHEVHDLIDHGVIVLTIFEKLTKC